jgi:dihydropteroate synthase
MVIATPALRPHASLAGILVGGTAPVVVMGALNVSPESFHPGSVHTDGDSLRRAAERMVEAGAALIDVGAMSTAPYLHGAVTEDEERRRLTRAVELLARSVSVPLSADTSRPLPARAAIDAGARVVNDVTGLVDPRLAEVAVAHDVSLILMASPPACGAPAADDDPVAFVRAGLARIAGRARAAGIPSDRLVLDPGIGFFLDDRARRAEWDLRVLGGLASLTTADHPLAIGVSRKSFVGTVTGRDRPADRLAGSLAATAIAVLGGVALVRTHDVAETIDAVRIAEHLGRARASWR